MAKLPPKIPSIVSQCNDDNEDHNHWLDLSHEHLKITQHEQPWVDEFMEFTAAKRTSHRRSVSESSVAFIEAGTAPYLCPGQLFRRLETGDGVMNRGDHFDKFDDEQFMCMFSNDIGGSSSNPSSTSDHNSTNDDHKRNGDAVAGDGGERGDGGEEVVTAVATSVKKEAEEVESSCNVEKDGVQGHGCVGSKEDGSNVCVEIGNGNVGDGCGSDQQQMVDPKRYKRILANRQSAQRSRVRKLQYISELERSVTALQNEVSILSPRVAFLDHQRMILNVDNSALKAKIAASAQDKIFKDAHHEVLKREIERLRQVYYQQNLKKTESIGTPSSSPMPSTTVHTPHQPDNIANEKERFTS